MGMIFSLLMFIILAAFWLFPIFMILQSPKVSGSEKLAWLLAVVFISWFAWIFFVLLAPVSQKERIKY